MPNLKKQSSTQTPAHAKMTWPTLEMPPVDHPDKRVTEAFAGQNKYLQEWYAGLQGSVNTRLAEMSNELESLKSKLNSK
jgi:hypothetical protein